MIQYNTIRCQLAIQQYNTSNTNVMQIQYQCYAGDENIRWCDATRQAADDGQRKRDGRVI